MSKSKNRPINDFEFRARKPSETSHYFNMQTDSKTNFAPIVTVTVHIWPVNRKAVSWCCPLTLKTTSYVFTAFMLLASTDLFSCSWATCAY